MPGRRRDEDDDFEDDRPRRRRRDDDEDDDEPRARRRREDYDDEDEPRPRRRSRRDEDEEDYDEEPRRKKRRASPAKLRAVAIRQKILIILIAAYLAAGVAQVFVPQDLRMILLIPFVIVDLVAIVFVFLLAIEIHGTGLGIVFGLLTLIPCVGLIILLIVNQQATSLLKKNGVRVGLFGANMSDLP